MARTNLVVIGLWIWTLIASWAWYCYPHGDNLITGWLMACWDLDGLETLNSNQFKFAFVVAVETAIVAVTFLAIGSIVDRIRRPSQESKRAD